MFWVFYTAQLQYYFHSSHAVEFLLKLLIVNVVENERWILNIVELVKYLTYHTCSFRWEALKYLAKGVIIVV